MEASTGVEPVLKVLQTSTSPLGQLAMKLYTIVFSNIYIGMVGSVGLEPTTDGL